MKVLFKKSWLALALLGVAPFVSQAEVDVAQLVKASEQAAYYAGDDGRTAARMLIVDSQGRKQQRQFVILRKDADNNQDQSMLVYFQRPADVAGTVFRVEKHTTQDDDRWLYLPSLDLVKRIAAGDKRTSFVGSHFFYEDVSGRSTEEDNFTLHAETDTDYQLKAMPKNPASVEFAYYQLHIDKTTKLPMKIDFFDGQGKVYRQVEALKVETVQGLPTVTESKVTDLVAGGYTLMQFKFTKYNLGIPQDVFSERSLRAFPQQWLDVKAE